MDDIKLGTLLKGFSCLNGNLDCFSESGQPNIKAVSQRSPIDQFHGKKWHLTVIGIPADIINVNDVRVTHPSLGSGFSQQGSNMSIFRRVSDFSRIRFVDDLQCDKPLKGFIKGPVYRPHTATPETLDDLEMAQCFTDQWVFSD